MPMTDVTNYRRHGGGMGLELWLSHGAAIGPQHPGDS